MNDVLLANSLAGRGHNSDAVPLAELLSEELAPSRTRAQSLLAAATVARIGTPADAGKVADLIVMIRDLERENDRARDGRRQPYAEQLRVVDAAFGAVTAPLSRARADTLQPLIDRWTEDHPDDVIAATVAAVGSRRKIDFCIDDLPAALAWLLETHPGQIAQAGRTTIGSHLRSVGVDMAGEANIPGVSITIAKRVEIR